MPLYTPVPIVSAGDWIDEVFINTYWGDNMAAGVPDIFSAIGDLAVGSGSDAAGILPIGSNGQLLVADATQPLGMKWGMLLRTVLAMSGPQSLSGTTLINWNQEIADDENLHDLVTNNTRITFTSPGVYLVGFLLRTQMAVTVVSFMINGVEDIYERNTASGTSSITLVKPIEVIAGDYIEVRVQTSGATNAGSASSRFWAIRLS